MKLYPTLKTVLVVREDKGIVFAKVNNLIDSEIEHDPKINRPLYKGWVRENEFEISRKGLPLFTYKPNLSGYIQHIDDGIQILIRADMSAGAQTNVFLQLLFLGGGGILMNWLSLTVRHDWSIYTLFAPLVLISVMYLLQVGIFIIEAKRDLAVLQDILTMR